MKPKVRVNQILLSMLLSLDLLLPTPAQVGSLRKWPVGSPFPGPQASHRGLSSWQVSGLWTPVAPGTEVSSIPLTSGTSLTVVVPGPQTLALESVIPALHLGTRGPHGNSREQGVVAAGRDTSLAKDIHCPKQDKHWPQAFCLSRLEPKTDRVQERNRWTGVLETGGFWLLTTCFVTLSKIHIP